LPKIAAGVGIDYASLCEAILSGARLYSGIPQRGVQDGDREAPNASRVSFEDRELRLVKRAAAAG
jgi:hypothetical protein